MTALATQEAHQHLVDELIDDVSAYNPEVDRDLLARAFRRAAQAHEGQQRRSGEPFVRHPWGVAKILAELRQDDASIAAALLHDVVEDTGVELDELRSEFGDEVARLVDGVTKLTRIQFQSREQAEAENYRKMIMAMAEDERVILIKLADRLHNLREIEYLGKQKQIQKAKETLEVYAPLAHRLGIHALKWELEDLAFATLHPRKDYVAMPKFNGYRSLHTTVIGPEGRPLEIQVRTREMHEIAELGIAAHWLYKRGKRDPRWTQWAKQLMEAQADEADPREFMKTFRTDLLDEEVYVFTPRGEVKSLPAESTPIDFAYAVHTDLGHRTVGAKINGRIVPLHYRLKSGDVVEILTTKAERGPSRDWLTLAASSRARNKIRQWFSRETRDETERKGRDALEQALKKQNLPYRKLAGSAVLAQVNRETGFKKADDFYVALGSGKLGVGHIVNKVLHRLKTAEVAEEETVPLKAPKGGRAIAGDDVGIRVKGVEDVLVRFAKCCTPVPGDDIVGYISLGKGITIHREDCSNVRALRRNPERFTPVEWDGAAAASFRVQIAVDSWDRPRLLEDVARTFAEHGANIVEYGGHVEDQLAKNWYVAEVGDVKDLRSLLTALRNVDAVFDAYRVTPS